MKLKYKKLIILDRDGVINQDSASFIKSVDEWISIKGSLTAIKKLNQANKIVALATNQSGIARGLFSMKTLTQIHQHLEQLLTAQQAHLDAIAYCPHGPDDDCACRKPKPGMLKTLLQRFKVDVNDAVLIGDAYRDLQAAHCIGMDAILVKTGKGAQTLQQHRITDPIYPNLLAAVEAIIDD